MHIHRRLFGLAKDVHGFLPYAALLSFLITCVIILQMYLLSLIIAEAFDGTGTPRLYLILMLLLSLFLRSVLVWLRERFSQRKAILIKSGLRSKLFDQILSLGPSFTKGGKTGETIAIVTDGIEKLDDYFTRYVPSVIHILVLPLAIIVFTFSTDWPSGMILFLTAPLILFFMWLIGTYAKRLTQLQWKELSSLSSHFLDALQGLKTLKTMGASHRESVYVDESSNRFRLVTMKVLKVAFLSGMVLELAASISIALVAVQVGIRLIEGIMVFQTGLFVLLLAPEFYLPFRSLGLHHHAGMEGAAAAKEIFQVLHLKPQDRITKDAKTPDPEIREIILKNIGFTYADGEGPALQNINCTLETGTLTALVGHTGAGKSTFANLLLGFIRQGEGDILVNGRSIRDYGQELWRKNIAYVSQHPWFFNATILKNILMARPGATMHDVVHATTQAEAHRFIEKLPLGYHTPITENASRLSGGEKQRLAIARAFLKDAPVLILDEPTSSLDPESEQLIAEATHRIMKNRTSIIIAHRLNTVRNASQILVFSEGTIAESGKHEELLQNKGIYAGFLQTMGVIKNSER
jgi:ATP-binding cassette, subfamily C, bacterial CydD